MKAKHWILIWVLLMLLELLTYWMTRNRPRADTLHPDWANPDLLLLAEATHRQWMQLGSLEPILSADTMPLPADADLLQRESLLLRLKDVESGLMEAGLETSLAADLGNWLDGLSGAGEKYPVIHYMTSLTDWLAGEGANTGECSLRRLSLHPGMRGRLPSLAFEMEGSPAAMGRSLLSLGRDGMPWKVEEMDILRDEQSPRWWMRGSLSFTHDHPLK